MIEEYVIFYNATTLGTYTQEDNIISEENTLGIVIIKNVAQNHGRIKLKDLYTYLDMRTLSKHSPNNKERT